MSNNNNKLKLNETDRSYNRPDREVEVDRSGGTRPNRVRFDKQNLLEAEPIPGYKLYFANETVGNVEAMERAGWTVVHSNQMNISEDRSQQASQMDSVVRIVVNQRSDAPCKTAVLMKIPEELYNEDRQLEEQERARLLDSVDPDKSRSSGADYGNVSFNKKLFKG